MELKDTLEERVRKDAIIVEPNMINVAGFINHLVDMEIMDEIGTFFAERFPSATKVLTVEASGIPPACFTAFHLKVPMLYAKKKLPNTLGSDVYFREAYSPTRGERIPLAISKRYLSEKDKILIVDDFLASGATCLALIDMIGEAGAELCGYCAIIEKCFEGGRERLRGIVDPYTIVKVKSIKGGQVTFA
jgi:xanthine phosphoribosyltransferase